LAFILVIGVTFIPKKRESLTHSGQYIYSIFLAEVHRHQSARAASLFTDNIPSAVYDSLVQTVRSNLKQMHRYMKLRKKILGLDELHMYDIYVPLVDVDWQIPYPEAVEILKKRCCGSG